MPVSSGRRRLCLAAALAVSCILVSCGGEKGAANQAAVQEEISQVVQERFAPLSLPYSVVPTDFYDHFEWDEACDQQVEILDSDGTSLLFAYSQLGEGGDSFHATGLGVYELDSGDIRVIRVLDAQSRVESGAIGHNGYYCYLSGTADEEGTALWRLVRLTAEEEFVLDSGRARPGMGSVARSESGTILYLYEKYTEKDSGMPGYYYGINQADAEYVTVISMNRGTPEGKTGARNVLSSGNFLVNGGYFAYFVKDNGIESMHLSDMNNHVRIFELADSVYENEDSSKWGRSRLPYSIYGGIVLLKDSVLINRNEAPNPRADSNRFLFTDISFDKKHSVTLEYSGSSGLYDHMESDGHQYVLATLGAEKAPYVIGIMEGRFVRQDISIKGRRGQTPVFTSLGEGRFLINYPCLNAGDGPGLYLLTISEPETENV